MMGVGLLASIVAIYSVRARAGETDALKPINRGLNLASIIALAGAAIVAFVYVGNPADAEVSSVGLRMFAAIVVGVVLGQVASRITQYFTSSQFKPVQDIAESGRTGPATVVLSGISSGLESAVWAVVAIAVAILIGLVLGGGNLLFAFYLVALTGIGMLSTTGIVVAEDTFGPIADNAQGIAEMSDELEGEAEQILDGLDTVGNTTKAVTKGFAIGSAVIAAVALFSSYIETIAKELGVEKALKAALGEGEVYDPNDIFRQVETQINVADVKTFIGLLIGGSVAMMFSALAIRAVGRTAGVVVQEVRNQFADGKIMKGLKKPNYAPVIDICTRASLRELTTPALLAVLTPVIVGFGIGYLALGAFLAGIILTGQLMANYLSNAGGAWDNAKKYIEDGHMGGKGSEAHKAAVIGDTVGDPFKDTAGPALNPLIKVMNLVSLLILPAIIQLKDDDIRFVIAGVSLLVLIGAIIFSSRSQQTLGEKAPAKKAAPVKKAAAKKAPAKTAIATTARKRAAR
jgi:K(+)-stimulated pyrophosphate-energized sodium pump